MYWQLPLYFLFGIEKMTVEISVFQNRLYSIYYIRLTKTNKCKWQIVFIFVHQGRIIDIAIAKEINDFILHFKIYLTFFHWLFGSYSSSEQFVYSHIGICKGYGIKNCLRCLMCTYRVMCFKRNFYRMMFALLGHGESWCIYFKGIRIIVYCNWFVCGAT